MESLPPSSSKKKPVSDWVCILMNQLAFPGLGTIMAGWRSGYLQATLMVVGFVLIMVFMTWFFICAGQYLMGEIRTEQEFKARYQSLAWAWKSGLIFCVVSWFWSLLSSIQLWRRSRAARPPTRVGPPPLPPAQNPPR